MPSRNLWGAVASVMLLCVIARGAAEEPPTEWIDPATGHCVIRLSTDPGSASLYFHQNAYSPHGKLLLITTPAGLAAVSLSSRKVGVLEGGRVRPGGDGRRGGDPCHFPDGQRYPPNG